MRRFFGVAKPVKQPENIGKKRFDMPRATGTGYHLDGSEFDRHLEVIIVRLAATPPAVDALLFVLNKIIDKPSDMKRRQVNVTKPVFFRTIGKSDVWGIRFLEAIGFQQSQNKQYYNLRATKRSMAKLKLGKEKLLRAQQSETYLLAQDKIQFARDTASLLSDSTEKENLAKIGYLGNVPSEPSKGAGGNTSVRVYFGEGDIKRFFASDNTLQGVLDWVCASLHSSLLDRLRAGEFELIDRTTYPPKKIEIIEKAEKRSSSASSGINLLDLLDDDPVIKSSEDKTLQALGLWPSGEVEIQKAGFLGREKALIGIFS